MANEIDFTPVPRKANRHDGWTAEKQQDFVAALAECGMVRAAAQKVGMSASTAYQLRMSEGSESFAAAWDRALKTGLAQLQDVAMDRALNGVAVPHFYKGELVGEQRWYDNRLLMFMLRQTSTRRFGPHAAQYDFIEDQRAAELAAERHRVDHLARTKEVIAALEADLAEIDPKQNREVHQSLSETHDRLLDLRDRLDSVDRLEAEIARLDALVAERKMPERTANIFKKRARERAAQGH